MCASRGPSTPAERATYSTNASLVFAAPTPVFVGEAITPDDVAARLRKGLYAESEGGSNVGTYRREGNRLGNPAGCVFIFCQ